jgi:hypothetical protein
MGVVYKVNGDGTLFFFPNITRLKTAKAATNDTNLYWLESSRPFVSFVAALKRPLVFMRPAARHAHEGVLFGLSLTTDRAGLQPCAQAGFQGGNTLLASSRPCRTRAQPNHGHEPGSSARASQNTPTEAADISGDRHPRRRSLHGNCALCQMVWSSRHNHPLHSRHGGILTTTNSSSKR